jgi:hypothetical protein
MGEDDKNGPGEPWKWPTDGAYWEGLADCCGWPEEYPGMPTVEQASRQADPVLWVRAWNQPDYVFYAAGCTLGEWDDRWIYGLLLMHGPKWFEWIQVDRWRLDTLDIGWFDLRVDESWSPVRASAVLRRYPELKHIPEEKRDEHPLHPFVTSPDFRTLKASLGVTVAITSLAIVGEDFDADRDGRRLGTLWTPMGWLNLEEREARARAMARQGKMSVAVRDLAPVPPEWRPYAMSFDDLPDDGPCEVFYTRGMYYVRPK